MHPYWEWFEQKARKDREHRRRVIRCLPLVFIATAIFGYFAFSDLSFGAAFVFTAGAFISALWLAEYLTEPRNAPRS